MKNIQLLDCTLRDGSYIVDSDFGSAAIRGILEKLSEADIDIIECGWLKDKEASEGSAFYHVPADLERYLSYKQPGKVYVAMIDWNRYNTDALPPYDGKSIDAVRVVFPHGKHREGIAVGERIREKGYAVYYQAANTLAYSDEDLFALARDMNEAKPVCLSVVDTFGAMYEDDLERILSILDKALSPEIRLGFHSHNNQQLSFALSMHFVRYLQKTGRQMVIDASLCGMGRGAGNATTELVASFLNKKCGCHYNLDAVMDAIDTYMEAFRENYTWGYSTPYFISGLYCCHVNNIAYLMKNHRTSARDMRNIIESMQPEDRVKYDYDLLEERYMTVMNRYIDDSEAVEDFKKTLAGRTVLLVAPGKSSLDEKAKIDAYIEEKHPYVIGVNAILPGYHYDALFFVNPARYDYAKNVNPAVFAQTPHLLLSNIKTEAGENERIFSYEKAVKRGWQHFDNAVICCLRLLERLEQTDVAAAGFDGFKHRYNESYADAFLPTLNPDNKWDELNAEITEIFSDFKASARYCGNVFFVTPSIFDKK